MNETNISTMKRSKEKVWAVLNQPAGLRPLDEWGSLMTVEDFLNTVESGGFIDYDGFGYWATELSCDDNVDVFPSKVRSGNQIPPKWATHVMWYNR